MLSLYIRTVADKISSDIPWLSFDIKLAVAGRTRTKSAHLDKAI